MTALFGMTKSRVAVVLLVLAGFGAAPALATDDEAAGRHHAAKGHRLAAKNNCTNAIISFSRAYNLLRDPTLLFNRAECYRKLRRNMEAIKDYEQFLAEIPDAPNRASVEARIVSLRSMIPEETKPATPPAPEDKAPGSEVKKDPQKAPEPPRAQKWED